MGIPMPFVSLLADEVLASGLVGLGGSWAMVEVDEVRLKVLARGAKCVSLSSARAVSAWVIGGGSGGLGRRGKCHASAYSWSISTTWLWCKQQRQQRGRSVDCGRRQMERGLPGSEFSG